MATINKTITDINDSLAFADDLRKLKTASEIEQGVNTAMNPLSLGYDIIVLIGQSNMIGRYGPIDPVLDSGNPQIFQYGPANASISIAQHPLPHSGVTSDTIGPGIEIGKAYMQTVSSKRKVLLFCGAIGGTGFSSGDWSEGGGRREYIKTEVNALIENNPNSKVVGFVWQQGERDDGQTQGFYSDAMARLIHEYRKEINTAAQAPFIVTEVGSWSTKYSIPIKIATNNLKLHIDNVGVVSAEGTTDGGDGLHMDAASLRLIGQRQGDLLNKLITNPVQVKESKSIGHWLLNKDNETFFDSKTGKELTPANLIPTIQDSHITLGDGDYNGLNSDIPDSSEQTICVVYRANSETDSFIAAGTLKLDGPEGGSAIFANGSGELRFNVRQASPISVGNFVVSGEWRFSALAESDLQYCFAGDLQSPFKNRKLINEKFVSAENIAVGNSYYDNLNFKTAIDVAEFIIFDTPLSSGEIEDVYNRSVSRLAAFGILVE